MSSGAMYVVGLISGTSADGVDTAIVEIKPKGSSLRIKELFFKTYPFPSYLQDQIIRISHERIKVQELAELNFRLGKFFGESVLKATSSSGVSLSRIKLIGSHGQTITHIPGKATMQIGEPAVIARMTGRITIADFRPMDIASGGEGAPLSCLLHYELFKEKGRSSLVINVGGISNFTYIPASGDKDKILAFDTGPGNMIIDGLVQTLTSGRERFDRHGKMAQAGFIDHKLLEELLAHPFIWKKPPKSTGREEFGAPIVKKLLKMIKSKRLKKLDAIATATAFTAESIYINYLKFIKDSGVDRIIVTGGGVKNRFLLFLMRKKFSGIPLFTFEDFGLNSDSAEAVAFALLAYETFNRRPGNIPSATGAKFPTILGKIIYP